MGKKFKLNDADWILLKALWDKPPQLMGSIVQNVRDMNKDIHWSYKTYYTYLNNLCVKGFAAYDICNAKSDRLYYPLITRGEAMKMESENLISRVSGDYLPKLIAAMAASDQIPEHEQKKLLELVSKLELDEAKRGD